MNRSSLAFLLNTLLVLSIASTAPACGADDPSPGDADSGATSGDGDEGTDSTTEETGTEGSSTETESGGDGDSSGGDGDAGDTSDDGDAGGDGDGDGDAQCSDADGSPSEDCSADAPFCVGGECVTCAAAGAGDDSCAALDPDAPYCDDQSQGCVECLGDGFCSGNTPICDEGFCRGCVAHAECGESACRLGEGPNQGDCFSLTGVYWVDAMNGDDSNPGTEDQPFETIAHALATTNQISEVTLRGDLGSYGNHVINGRAVALLADPGLNSWMYADPTGDFAFQVGPQEGSELYVANMEVTATIDNAASIDCDNGIVYVENTTMSDGSNGPDFVIDANACNIDLLGVDVFPGQDGAIRAAGASNLVAQNASIGGPSLDFPAVQVTNGSVDLVYSTLRGRTSSVLSCTGSVSGEMRNSILANDSMDLVSNCVDVDTDHNTYLTGADSNVFASIDPPFLLESTQSNVAATAVWAEGDPMVDIEGDARPADGFPGVDEP